MSQNTSASIAYECVRYILYREGSKIPILHEDLAKHLRTKHKISRSELKHVINEANDVLRNVYGYKLVKEGGKSHVEKEAKEVKKENKKKEKKLQYLVVLEKPCDTPASPLTDAVEQQLLNIALSHIVMSGRPVKDEDMWGFLKETNLVSEVDDTIKSLFTKTFHSQLYITCTKDGNTTCFDWGPRAHIETSKLFMLKKVAEALKREPEFWNEQYLVANQQANGNVNPPSR